MSRPTPTCSAAALALFAGSVAAQPILVGSDVNNDTLVLVDPLTAGTTVIGPLGDDVVSALAYDPNNNILYGFSNSGGGRLLRVDPATGAATVIGPAGLSIFHGLEYDSTRDILFGVTSFGNNSLYRFNVTTGQATLVAPHGKGGLQGLAYDEASDTMWAAEINEHVLYKLNTTTGGLTLVGPFNAPGNGPVGNSLAWDPGVGLFATDNKFSNAVDDQLFKIDTATGQATLVGNLNTGNCLGLEFVGGGTPPCYPDCDTSTGPGVLDVFDFLCFQNRYDAGASYACDCDTSTGPGVCDVFDFLCFQNAYDAGCP